MCALAHVLERRHGAEPRIAHAMRPGPRGGIPAPCPAAAGIPSQGHGINLVAKVKRLLPSSKRDMDAFPPPSPPARSQCGRDLAGWKRAPQTRGMAPLTRMPKISQRVDYLAESPSRKRVSLGGRW